LPPAKDRAVGKDFLCRPHLKAVGKEFFADCPTILAGGKERLVAKVAAWQVAKKSWWQKWRVTNGAHLRPLCHLPSR